MNTFVVQYQSSDYVKMLKLRYRILRQPLGLNFDKQELEKESADIFCIYKLNEDVVGCCVLSPIDVSTIKLRQMAVSEDCRNRGIGSMLLQFAEKTAAERGFKQIVLHARKTASGFYQANKYQLIGSEFLEVGILHIKMQKDI